MNKSFYISSKKDKGYSIILVNVMLIRLMRKHLKM